MKDRDEIKELFQKELGNYQVKVNPNLWHGVQAGIGGVGATSGVAILGKIAIGAVVATGITVGSIFYFKKNEAKVPASQPTEKVHPLVSKNSTNKSLINHQEKQKIDTPHYKIEKPNALTPIKNTTSLKNDDDNLVNIDTNKHSNIAATSLTSHSTSTPSSQNERKNNASSTINKGETVDATEQTSNSSKTTSLNEATISAAVANQKNQFVQFAATGVPEEAKVEWDFGDGNFDTSLQPEHFYSTAGNYTVRLFVTTPTSTVTKSIPVRVVVQGKIGKLPNTMTPNGDGNNDYLYLHTENLISFHITIMDRNQHVIYTSNDPNFKWNGVDKYGNPVEEGNYIYMVVGKDSAGSVINKYQQLHIYR